MRFRNVIVVMAFYLLIVTVVSSFGAEDKIGQDGRLVINLETLAQLVKEKNDSLLVQKLEWQIKKEGINNARSIFEPQATLSYKHVSAQEQKLAEDWAKENSIASLIPIEQDIRDDINDIAAISVEKVVKTGAVLQLSYSYDILDNQYNKTIKNSTENKTFLGASLKQPLLKNAGSKVTMANILIAEVDADVGFQTYRQKLMRTMLEAMGSYWDFYLNQEKYKIRQDSIKIAESILAENRLRVIAGKMAETEISEAQMELLTRNAYLSAAQQSLVTAKNNLLLYISSSVAEQELDIHANEVLNTILQETSFDDSLNLAVKWLPEYLAVRNQMTQADIRVAYMKNQRWPQLDLNASYGLNGLKGNFGDSLTDALSRKYVAWQVGLEFKIPLQGGIKTRSELNAAQHRKRQSLHELHTIEIRMANMIDAAIKSVDFVYEQVQAFEQVEKLSKQLLDVELLRLDAGKSTSKFVFEREEKFNKAREAKLESLVNYQKVLLSLAMTEGVLLDKYHVDVKPHEVN